MSRWPKPGSFWDYALPALFIAGMLLLLFWVRTSHGLRWGDAALALTASALVFGGIAALAPRHGKPRKPRRGGFWAGLVLFVAALGSMFGLLFADTYLFHPEDMSTRLLVNDGEIMAVVAGVAAWRFFWSKHRRPPQDLSEVISPSQRR
jgi:hypothetical protein